MSVDLDIVPWEVFRRTVLRNTQPDELTGTGYSKDTLLFVFIAASILCENENLFFNPFMQRQK